MPYFFENLERLIRKMLQNLLSAAVMIAALRSSKMTMESACSWPALSDSS